MGYACPVCEDPQADGEHLANHLAFTAMLRGDDHEQWLDDHVADWADMDPPELAAAVVDHATDREYPQVFEDTTGDGHSQNHDHDHAGRGPEDHDSLPGGVDAQVPDADGVPEDVLSEARELTRERREAAADDPETDESSSDGPPDDESATEDTDE
jgi:hypothetical protein